MARLKKAYAPMTPEEKSAVDLFMAAAKALPESICIDVDDAFSDDEDEPTLSVRKRTSAHSASLVAELYKPSLCF